MEQGVQPIAFTAGRPDLPKCRRSQNRQFLFLRFEDLMRMKAPALIQLLSNFTGLYTDDAIIRQMQVGSEPPSPFPFCPARQLRRSLTQRRRRRPCMRVIWGRMLRIACSGLHSQSGADCALTMYAC